MTPDLGLLPFAFGVVGGCALGLLALMILYGEEAEESLTGAYWLLVGLAVLAGLVLLILGGA